MIFGFFRRRRGFIVTLRPHVGALPIRLGQRRDTVERLMAQRGQPLGHRHGNSDYYLASRIQIEFRNDRADFIGIAPGDGLELRFGRERLTGRTAEDVAAIFARGETHPPVYDADEMVFRDQILTLWNADAQYAPGEAHPAWGQIGIGTPAYLAAAWSET